MSAVYSRLFLSAAGLSSNITYTVPSGFVAVIRDWTIFHGIQASAIQARLRISGTVTLAVYQDTGISAASDLWQGRVVVDALDTIEVVADAGNVDTTVTGYLLSLP